MSFITGLIDFASDFLDLVRDQAEWSPATFGADAERGPLGALKHLEKEAREAQEACVLQEGEDFLTKLADCLLLILDATRRAGWKPHALVKAALEKMKVNRARVWPKTVGDVPTEHAKEQPQ